MRVKRPASGTCKTQPTQPAHSRFPPRSIMTARIAEALPSLCLTNTDLQWVACRDCWLELGLRRKRCDCPPYAKDPLHMHIRGGCGVAVLQKHRTPIEALAAAHAEVCCFSGRRGGGGPLNARRACLGSAVGWRSRSGLREAITCFGVQRTEPFLFTVWPSMENG
jgi:hypothetical protein